MPGLVSVLTSGLLPRPPAPTVDLWPPPLFSTTSLPPAGEWAVLRAGCCAGVAGVRVGAMGGQLFPWQPVVPALALAWPGVGFGLQRHRPSPQLPAVPAQHPTGRDTSFVPEGSPLLTPLAYYS